jgi:hypothetical protein
MACVCLGDDDVTLEHRISLVLAPAGPRLLGFHRRARAEHTTTIRYEHCGAVDTRMRDTLARAGEPRSDAAGGGGQGPGLPGPRVVRRPAPPPARRDVPASGARPRADPTRRAEQRSMEAEPWGTCVPPRFLCFCHHLHIHVLY